MLTVEKADLNNQLNQPDNTPSDHQNMQLQSTSQWEVQLINITENTPGMKTMHNPSFISISKCLTFVIIL